MNSTSLSAVAAAVSALESAAQSPENVRALDDPALLELSRVAARARQLADAQVALIAGEIERRSARELGSAGMAQRLGLRTAEELVRVTNRSTAREASLAVRVGRLVTTDAEAWLAPVAQSVRAGDVSVSSADAIRSGLGAPGPGVSESILAEAAARLCGDAATLDPDRLQRRARELRDELDEAGLADRESARRAQRSLRVTRLPDGMTRATWLMDPETSAVFGSLYDRATSPRRGGPRFVADDDRAAAEAILADARTTEQLASDVFLELLRQGAAADSSELLGSGGASITVHVTQTALSSRTGHGYVEGQADAISIETVERLACSGGMTEVTFGADGQPLDLGREQRLYTRRQRRALAARDGGCMAPGCDRPPSWTEAHHIKHWARDGGRTDIADGILLCRHHHLLFHNNGWEIDRDGCGYWLVPPLDVDPLQARTRLESKSPLRRGARVA
jgi:hypothetical protein